MTLTEENAELYGLLLKYRQRLREALYRASVPSNPAVDDDWILDRVVEQIAELTQQKAKAVYRELSDSPWVVTPQELRDMDLQNTLGKMEMEHACKQVIRMCADSMEGWDFELDSDDFSPSNRGDGVQTDNDIIYDGFLHLLGRGWLVSYAGGQGFCVTPGLVEFLAQQKDVPVGIRHLERTKRAARQLFEGK